MRPQSERRMAALDAVDRPGSSTQGAPRTLKAVLLLTTLAFTAAGTWASASAAPNEGAPWAKTGSLTTSRAFFTATLLKNGKVLVVGGANTDAAQAEEALRSAELYDPVKGTWSRTGALQVGRSSHTATLLNSGKVLVVGGESGGTSELYDPSTGRWERTASMATPVAGHLSTSGRPGHTATLLKSGKALVVGEPAAGGETYDPLTGKWTKTSELPAPRSSHTATLLKTGKVLVVGGLQGSKPEEPYASPSVYNPVTGKWENASASGGRRFGHTAVLLQSGKVLVAGGQTDPASGGPSGAVDITGRTVAVEMYDPVADTWAVTGPLPFVPVFHEASALRNGSVLLVGAPYTNAAEAPPVAGAIYDPAFATWAKVATGVVEAKPFELSMTVLDNGKVLLTGDGGASYLYSPAALDGESRRSVWLAAPAAIVGLIVLFKFVRWRRQRSRRPVRATGGFSRG